MKLPGSVVGSICKISRIGRPGQVSINGTADFLQKIKERRQIPPPRLVQKLAIPKQ
jgi:hypothetical protein